MTAQRRNNTPGGSQRISPTLIQPNEESTIPEDGQIQLQQPQVELFLSLLTKEPPSAPEQPEPLTVTRSGRIVRRPARYSK